ncbi:glycoside hydrolase family 3 protein [Pengzhenrongella frigida]|uniref:beta-N-acetylhexosaminidase n=2 Tax=Pengzhenrongella frigida TaxID=1259133 RepID=A0A4Q5MYC3_9MICO|nr:glycoside hydrolase family 3 protein [Cellulomonas sp. HLT2-17]
MSLEEKVGQLFVTNVYGSQADVVTDTERAANRLAYGVDTGAEVVRKYHLGGAIYFTWTNSVQNPSQITALSNGLQAAALDSGAEVPLLVAIDQEQGIVTRVGPPATQLAGNMALGAGRSSADTRTAAQITGAELRAMGINQDFAPDADVNVNPANPVIGVRSFSSDPTLAADLTAAAVAGYQDDAGIAATAKHFPGHGDTAVDSHLGIPLITHTREQWETLDAPPFRAAIDAGVDSIMTGHIVVPALDPSGVPATLSKPIVTGVLRQELGFDGVVYTDALTMEGVRAAYTDAEIPVLALEAGVDVLLMPFEGSMDVAYQGVLDAVRSGRISERRLDQSVRRVLELKVKNGIVAAPMADPAGLAGVVGTPEHLATAQAITDRTTTLVTNDGTLPITPAGARVLVVGPDAATTGALTTSLGARGAHVTTMVTGTSPDAAMRAAAVVAAGGSDVVVALTNNAHGGTAAAANVRALLAELGATPTPLVAAAIRNPYDVAYGAGVESWLATYSVKPVAIEALARTITGEVTPQGALPVDVPAAGEGTTAYPFGAGLGW